MVQIIKFSKDYSKLEDNVFTTIRRYDRYNVGDKVIIKTPSKKFQARVLYKWKDSLGNLTTKFLCYDTDTNNIIEAMKVLNSFYRSPLFQNEIMTIIILKRID